jgi:hypothetical protein
MVDFLNEKNMNVGWSSIKTKMFLLKNFTEFDMEDDVKHEGSAKYMYFFRTLFEERKRRRILLAVIDYLFHTLRLCRSSFNT